MNKCYGWKGKLFGHKFKSFLAESIAPSPEQIKESINPKNSYTNQILLPSYTEDILAALRSAKYIVLCKRCGIKNGDI